MGSYDTTTTKSTEAAVVAELAKRATEVQPFRVGDVEVFRNPGNGEISALDKFRKLPIRHNFNLDVADAESFLKAVRHFGPKEIHLAEADERVVLTGLPRVVHFSISNLTVTCVLNHSDGETPNWHDATVQWKLERDPFLKLWLAKADTWLTQDQLMEFLEDRLEDVVQNPKPSKNLLSGPSQSELISVISDLRITTDATFTSKKDLHNGNYVFESSKQDKPSVEVPAMFYLGLPFFDGSGDGFIFPIRLYYRLSQGKLTFRLAFHNFRKIQDTAWEGVRAAITAGLPKGVPFLNVP